MASFGTLSLAGQQIKAHLRPLRTLFDYIVENYPRQEVTQIVPEVDPRDNKPVFIMVMGQGRWKPWIWENLPAGKTERLARAMSKRCLCEVSVFLFLEALQTVFARHRVSVQPLQVWANPSFRTTLRYPHGVRDATLTLAHTVYWITDANGAGYIMDLTAEQYGFDEDSWFLPALDYLHRNTAAGSGVARGFPNGFYRDMRDSHWYTCWRNMERVVTNHCAWEDFLMLEGKKEIFIELLKEAVSLQLCLHTPLLVPPP